MASTAEGRRRLGRLDGRHAQVQSRLGTGHVLPRPGAYSVRHRTYVRARVVLPIPREYDRLAFGGSRLRLRFSHSRMSASAPRTAAAAQTEGRRPSKQPLCKRSLPYHGRSNCCSRRDDCCGSVDATPASIAQDRIFDRNLTASRSLCVSASFLPSCVRARPPAGSVGRSPPSSLRDTYLAPSSSHNDATNNACYDAAILCCHLSVACCCCSTVLVLLFTASPKTRGRRGSRARACAWPSASPATTSW